jgi:hypothetical protein
VNRREAIQSLAGLVSATGLTVTPITERQAENIALLVFRTDKKLTIEQSKRIRELLRYTTNDTALEGVKCVVLENGDTLEVVTAPKGTSHGDRQ